MNSWEMGEMKVGEAAAGWVLCLANGSLRWMRGISKAGAHYVAAHTADASWCRPFVVRGGVKVVCC